MWSATYHKKIEMNICEEVLDGIDELQFTMEELCLKEDRGLLLLNIQFNLIYK